MLFKDIYAWGRNTKLFVVGEILVLGGLFFRRAREETERGGWRGKLFLMFYFC